MTILDRILETKREEVAEAKQRRLIADLQAAIERRRLPAISTPQPSPTANTLRKGSVTIGAALLLHSYSRAASGRIRQSKLFGE